MMRKYEYKTCPNCKGSGNVKMNGSIKTCPVCQGRGIIKQRKVIQKWMNPHWQKKL